MNAAPTSPYAQQIVANGPIAYWRLDETNGAGVARDGVGGHDCLYHNTQLQLPGYSPGDPDPAAGFGLLSASNSYAGEIDNSGSGTPRIDFAVPMGGNGAFTIEAWVNGAGLAQDPAAGIVTKGYLGAEQFNLDEGVPTFPLRFQVRNALGSAYNTYSSLSLYTNAGWHHVVGVCDEINTKVLLYVDGVLAASNSIPANSGIEDAGGVPLMIGARATDAGSGADKQFFGYMDEVAIYDYALTAEQVAEDYRVGTSSIPWFASVEKRGGEMVMGGYGGAGHGAFKLLTTTNLGLAMTDWTVAGSNQFDGNGTFSVTNAVNPNASRQFYALQVPPAQGLGNPDLWIPACGAWLGAEVSNSTVANFSAHESKIGRQLDILRFYHATGEWTALTSKELNYINAGRKILVSFKPASSWSAAVSVADGGSATVNAALTNLAQSVASIKPRKLMVCVWHEPQNNVNTTGRTPEDYVLMWQNVRHIFDGAGATNVIWVWNLQGNPVYVTPSAINPLWPGNAYVDWVTWDKYQSAASQDFIALETGMYNFFVTNSDSIHNYLSKPWGWAEWGIGQNSYYPTVAVQTNAFNAINAALNANQFPKVKMAAYYDNLASTLLPGAELSYSNLANSPYLTQQCPP